MFFDIKSYVFQFYWSLLKRCRPVMSQRQDLTSEKGLAWRLDLFPMSHPAFTTLLVHTFLEAISKIETNSYSCGKYFTESGSLKYHIKAIHEGQRNYKCHSCGKSFTQSGNLKKHIKRVHEWQRNHECDICEKSFAQLLQLNNHVHIKKIHETK